MYGIEVNSKTAKYNDTTKGEMFAFTHGEGESAVTDYRYIGYEPNNYVNFNCDENGENCETWRIVGVSDVDDGTGKVEQRMKLVRGELLDNDAAWNSSGINEWNDSSLATTLNGTYYDSLSTSAKSMIGDAKYYLGGRKWDDDTHYGSTEDMYIWERGTEVYTEDGITKAIEWTGKVALLYPSDYGYTYANGVEKECFEDLYMCYEREATPSDEVVNNHPEAGWIYNSNKRSDDTSSQFTWLLSPYAGDSAFVFYMDQKGFVYYSGYVSSSHEVRPVVYLTSDVKITSGDGSSSNPYTLSK